jgi:predicted dithiol-disulfide oxidoreductase (DUF899 family)
MNSTLVKHPITSPSDWITASQELLAKEKAFTKARDEITRLRQALPWTKVEQNYTFETEAGPKTLSELFNGKSQLIAYHFMYEPDDAEGCPGCSFVCDHVDGARQHFEHHDISFVAVSIAPIGVFQDYKKRMGWTFNWVSSAGTTFNYDFGVSFHRADLDAGPVMYNFKVQQIRGQEQPGLTVFIKGGDGEIYRTYSTYERGLDMLLTAYHYIDLTPVGRNEKGPMDWVQRHDQYGG